MTIAGWVQILALVAVLTALTPLLGGYMAKVYQGERVALSGVLGPIERIAYRAFGVTSGDEQDWKQYARSVLLFSAASWLLLYLILRTQGIQRLSQSIAIGPVASQETIKPMSADGGGFFTRTQPTRSRTPRPCPTSWRSC